MAENSAISWTDHTFNPWIGCTKVSPACDGCYAEALMGMPGRFGPARVQWGAPGVGEGTRSRTAASTWRLPRKWDREAAKLRAEFEARYDGLTVVNPPPPVFVFCASLADVFDNAVPVEWRADLFSLIHATPNLTWLLLTKRPGNIVKLGMASDPDPNWRWPRNAAIGCTVVNQEEADRDIPKLLAAKAALNPAFAFLSMEPLLGPVDLTPWLDPDGACEGCDSPGCERLDVPREQQCPKNRAIYDYPEGPPDEEGVPSWIASVPRTVDWVIAGGETDQGAHKARPADPSWFRALRDQCAAAGVPFHFKQWGEWQPGECAPPISGPQTGAYFDDGEVSIERFTQREADELTCENEPAVWRVGKHSDPCTLDGVRHDARPALP